MIIRGGAATLPGPGRLAVVSMAILLVASLGLTGCAVQFVGQYDQQTVDAVTALLKKIETQLIKLERTLDMPGGAEQAKYENYADFYDEIKLDMSLIRVRAKALPQNERTVKQIDELEAAIKDFEELHRRGLNKPVVSTARKIITQTIEAILKAEFAKRRGQ